MKWISSPFSNTMAFLEYHKEWVQAKWLYTTLVQMITSSTNWCTYFPLTMLQMLQNTAISKKIIIHHLTKTATSPDIPIVEKDHVPYKPKHKTTTTPYIPSYYGERKSRRSKITNPAQIINSCPYSWWYFFSIKGIASSFIIMKQSSQFCSVHQDQLLDSHLAKNY
jgi:hypothetical protein